MTTLKANIDVGWTGSTLTFVALRSGVSLGIGAATLTTVAGVLIASGSINLSAAGAGDVDFILRDPLGAVAWSASGVIDAAGNLVDDSGGASAQEIADAVIDEFNTNPPAFTVDGASAESIATAVSGKLAVRQISDIVAFGLPTTDHIVVRGTTWAVPMPFVGPATWSRMEFTARKRSFGEQAKSAVWIVKSNPDNGADGLRLPLSGAAGGSITSIPAGAVTVRVAAAVSAGISPDQYDYDIKVFSLTGDVTQQARGILHVQADVTRTAT